MQTSTPITIYQLNGRAASKLKINIYTHKEMDTAMDNAMCQWARTR